jgi:hypothetical protein
MIMPSGGSDSRDANVNMQTGGKSESRPDECVGANSLRPCLRFNEVLMLAWTNGRQNQAATMDLWQRRRI